MKATIDQGGCISCGLCAEICPDVFRMADSGVAEVYNNITPENEAAANEAAESCPVSVIAIENE